MEIIAFAAAALAYATPAVAQGKGKGRAGQRTSATVNRTTGDIFGTTPTSGHDRVPPGHLPPRGMCRVWIDGVPPGHQPPVTDCATAQMQRTTNSRVIYGDDTPFPGNGRRSTNTADGRVVTNDGRECERTDRTGNVRFECRNGRNDPSGIYTDRGRVYGRDDDDEDDDGGFISRDNDRDDFELRGAGNAGNGKGKVKNKSKGKRGRG
jgi:hypothetical protein